MRSLLLLGVLAAAPAFAQSLDCAQIPETAGLEPAGYDHCYTPSPGTATENRGGLPFFGTQLRGTSPLGVGFISFDAASPAAGTLVAPTTQSFFAGDFQGDNFGQLYAIDFGAAVLPALYTIDVATGVATVVGATGLDAGINVSGMSWDYTTNTMFATTAGTAPALHTVDLTTGTMTEIGPIAGDGLATPIDLMADPNTGMLYSVDIGNESLYSIDKVTGDAGLIGDIGYVISFAQGGDFDNASGVLYLCAYQGGGVNSVRSINLDSGLSTEVGTFTNSEVDICANMNPLNTIAVGEGASAGMQLENIGANPARDAARVALRLSEAQYVTVEAFDLVGRRVAVLHSGAAAAGTLALTLEASSLPAGVYVVRATGETGVASLRVSTVR